MEAVFNSIDDICELILAFYSKSDNSRDYYYFNEQSSLQVLRELPRNAKIRVTNLFSERQQIFQNIDKIKGASTVEEFLDIILPFVKGGNFPCSDITIIIDDQIELSSHDDGEIHMLSSNKIQVQNLAKRILRHQGYDDKLLEEITAKEGIYCRLERPDKIISTYSTFEEFIDSI